MSPRFERGEPHVEDCWCLTSLRNFNRPVPRPWFQTICATDHCTVCVIQVHRYKIGTSYILLETGLYTVFGYTCTCMVFVFWITFSPINLTQHSHPLLLQSALSAKGVSACSKWRFYDVCIVCSAVNTVVKSAFWPAKCELTSRN